MLDYSGIKVALEMLMSFRPLTDNNIHNDRALTPLFLKSLEFTNTAQ